MTLNERRKLTLYSIKEHKLSERHACRLMGISRSVYRYQAKLNDDSEIAACLQALAKCKPRWGFGKMFHRLRQQGYGWNHKRVRRIYRAAQLNIRVKVKKRLPVRQRVPLTQPAALNEAWSADFMRDTLLSGRVFRTLNVIDEYNREVLAIEIDTSLPSGRVVRVLERIASWRGYPKQLRLDNGPEFISRQLATWAEAHAVRLAFIEPGKPAQNGYIERFNRTYREDVLDLHPFDSLAEVRELTERWIEEYNGIRQHESLGNTTPYQYATIYRQLPEGVHF